MPAENQPPKSTRLLVNKLTVDDARHLLHNEGGTLTVTDIALRLASAGVVAALTARALWLGNATVWHLALPMVAQYLALIAALPVLYLLARHPGLHKDAIQALRLWIGFAVAGAITIAVRSQNSGLPWREQLDADVAHIWRWIADANMQWPMLAAAVSMLLELPGRVRNLFQHGPPFVGVGLGCAMQFVVILLGCFLLPLAVGSSTRMAWALWAVILLAEVLALGMHWDIQRRLEKIDGPGDDARASQ